MNARLSDRMSRSEMAVLLPSPPTALQVMITDIVDGIVETNILKVLAVCSKWAGWALRMADGGWHLDLVLLQWRPWFLLHWLLWFQSPVCHGRWPCFFYCLSAQPFSVLCEALHWQCLSGWLL